MARAKRNPHRGSSLAKFLDEEGLLADVEKQAVKELLALQITDIMKKEGVSKAAMAKRMGTSRPALDRLLDGKNGSVTLNTLQRAAEALGRTLRVELV